MEAILVCPDGIVAEWLEVDDEPSQKREVFGIFACFLVWCELCDDEMCPGMDPTEIVPAHEWHVTLRQWLIRERKARALVAALLVDCPGSRNWKLRVKGSSIDDR
jgi:hypothetical protein